MKIIKGLKGSLILFIISALFFINAIPSSAVQGNLKFTYDDLNRLTVMENTTDSKNVIYKYDEVGNRTQRECKSNCVNGFK